MMMKFAVLLAAMLMSSAAAFTAPSMTFAVAKKAPAKKKVAKKVAVKKVVAKKIVAKKVVVKKAPPKKVVVKKAPPKKVVAKKSPPKKVVAKKSPPPPPKKSTPTKSVGTIPSAAIPGEEVPSLLDGSLVGDAGFDPCFLSTKAEGIAPYFNGLFGTSLTGLEWYREAELMHGRICMVAVLGFIWPGFQTFGGNDWTGLDAYSYTNPLEALDKAPSAALLQIFAFMGYMEFRRITIILEEGSKYMVGDAQRWGQGPGRWNPFGLAYTPAEYEEKQLQEIKHARLAMIGFLGLVFQANASGVGVVEQWSTALISPEPYSKAGYFFPAGI